ncbi:PPC domain-containing protein [Nostoc favosum]|uniref:Pre-peptidase C-terminal domain-containing protein n=1 Tax=Nostoc favosum CHAB5714 TaxID=2780399 RepID=A0ABS8I404_9NOSO|nr:PPC domain-containing protein [Nostoc favosum]MCC5598453.1 pre-peptidase C-terminal domain-containing protein [Nostoc favosum CHAB5714]
MAAEFSLGTLSNTPAVISNFVGDLDPQDTFSFSLPSSGGNINLALTGLSGNADVKVFKDLNSNGIVDGVDTEVGTSSRSGTFDEGINIANQAAGPYVAQVDPFSSNSGYDLRLSTTALNSPSNLLSSDVLLGVLTSSRNFKDSLSNNDTSDIYNFVVDTAGSFRFTLDPVESLDPDLRLIQDINSNLVVDPGEVIAASSAGPGVNDVITNFLNPGDNYFVQVYQFSGDPINYSLNATPV